MEPVYTDLENAEVAAYHRPRYLAGAIEFVLTPLILAIMVVFVTRPLWRFANRLGDRLEAWTARTRLISRLNVVANQLWSGPGWAGALLFALLFFEVFGLTELPAEIGLGYFHEHAHGMSRASPAVFAMDLLKAKGVFALALSSLVFGLYGLARRTVHWWWLLGGVAGVLLLFSAALDPFRARLYVDQTPLEQGPLREQITALMKKAEIDFRDVLVEHTSDRSVRVQAYFAGVGPTRTIVLNDSLLGALTTQEVLSAVAHEAAHVEEPRWLPRLASAGTLTIFLFVIERLFRTAASRRWFDVSRRADVRTLPLIALTFSLALSLAAPVSAAMSRQRELEADRYAVVLTGDAPTFRSMLRKAARVNKMDVDPPRWVVWQGWSHPPITERLAAIR